MILQAMQGLWRLEQAFEAGVAVLPRDVFLHVESDRFERRTPGYVYRRRIVCTPQEHAPAWIDLHITNPPGLGEVLRGLVEVEGDRMRICHAPPGAARPAEFASNTHNRCILSLSVRA